MSRPDGRTEYKEDVVPLCVALNEPGSFIPVSGTQQNRVLFLPTQAL
jgi:hypothetical protein